MPRRTCASRGSSSGSSQIQGSAVAKTAARAKNTPAGWRHSAARGGMPSGLTGSRPADRHALPQGPRLGVEDEYLLRVGDDGDPAAAKGHRLGGEPVGKHDMFGQARPDRGDRRQADDKEHDDSYPSGNHRPGKGGDGELTEAKFRR